MLRRTTKDQEEISYWPKYQNIHRFELCPLICNDTNKTVCRSFGFRNFLFRAGILRIYTEQVHVLLKRRWKIWRLINAVTQVRGFKPGRSRRILGRKCPQHATFGGEVKPSVPCRRSAACKRSINLSGSRNLGKITGHLSRPQFQLSLLGSLASLRTYRHLATKVGTSKSGGKQWQTNPKNLPRMQCARTTPVTWLGSSSCQPGL